MSGGRTYKLRKFSPTAILIALGLIFVFYFAIYAVYPRIISAFVGMIMLAFVVMFVMFRYGVTYRLTLDDGILSIGIFERGRRRIEIRDITTIMYKQEGGNKTIELYIRPAEKIFMCNSLRQEELFKRFLVDLLSRKQWIQANEHSWIEHVNGMPLNNYTCEYIDKVQASDFSSAPIEIRKKSKGSNPFVVGALVFVCFFCIVPFLFNPKEFYSQEDGKVYYGDKEIIDVDVPTFSTMSYNVAKDSLHVYYKGEVREELDASTFNWIEQDLYRDTSGVYVEVHKLFSPDHLKKLDYIDANKFRKVGYFFKDDKRVYQIDTYEEDRLSTVVPVADMDVPTFGVSGVSPYWYFDKNHVYYFYMDGMDMCLAVTDEIDPKTFEVLSQMVARDANHAYLYRGGQYKIWRNMDMSTFKKIDEYTFEDKYGRYSSRNE
ncbi:DKNYY domain-containing protein [Dysgonomonas macrotermitis]|uniref:DKNYY family protein n=1 Tax=Dysgonomonas macrotermitis TaxID=1346286 RepID=A0A1M4Y741_9BACT|nr:DKNYY domain-containing protein [Dysgonomonas macrotermitis]SHF01489.1 DKNYY family protein [Dysgonomonas macrotermitis]